MRRPRTSSCFWTYSPGLLAGALVALAGFAQGQNPRHAPVTSLPADAYAELRAARLAVASIENEPIRLRGVEPYDDCETAPLIECGSVTLFDLNTTDTLVSDPVYSCREGVPARGAGSAWAKFVAPSGPVRISTCGSSDGTDSLLAVYRVTNPDSSCNGLFEVGCGDDGCGAGGLLSEIYLDNLIPGNLYYIQLAAWDEFSRGVYALSLQCFDCELACAGATPEGEPTCTDGYIDTTNGGCLSSPPAFLPIACGETVCGESGTFRSATGLAQRDADVYRVVLPSGADVTLRWSVTAEFPVLVGIINTAGVDACPAGTFLAPGPAVGDPCEPTEVEATVGGGTWYLWVSPDPLSGVTCGARYVATLDACIPGACCVGSACELTTRPECTDGGGIFVGEGSSCTPSPCAIGACCTPMGCEVMSSADCVTAGGLYQGDGMTCEPSTCAGCGGFAPGDSNCDGAVNFDDIECFISALISPEAWHACGHAEGCDYICQNDPNGDRAVNFDDIEAFVVCLIAAGCP